jgi:hypothetical protein
MKWILLLALSFSLYFSSIRALAGEGKEESGEKGEKKSQPEWVDVEMKINSIASKMQMKKENLAKLVEEKHKLPANSPKIKETVDEMVQTHKELESLTQDYNQQVTLYKYRFPERGAKEHRNYERTQVKPLDQMEKELSIDDRLHRNMKTIRSQYGVEKPGTPAANTASEKPAEHKEPTEGQKTLDDSNSIIMKK